MKNVNNFMILGGGKRVSCLCLLVYVILKVNQKFILWLENSFKNRLNFLYKSIMRMENSNNYLSLNEQKKIPPSSFWI